MHGIYPENVGVNTRLFEDEDDFLTISDHSAMILPWNVMDKPIIFIPFRLGTIWLHLKSKHMLLMGMRFLFTPQEKDFETHRSYQYQDLTTRGTVEFRSVCTQPLDRTFASATFHLGLLVNLDKLEAYLRNSSLSLKNLGEIINFKTAIFKKSSDEEETAIIEFSKTYSS